MRRKVKELNEKLVELQSKQQTKEMIDKSRQMEMELCEVLMREETMWYQRSRALWIKDGDKNTSFFHQKASQRQKQTTVTRIQDQQHGRWVDKFEEIAGVMTERFVDIFRYVSPRNVHRVLDSIESRVTPEMNDHLTKPYTKEEILAALKQMYPSKAPGPNGMSPLFLQKFWHVFQNDFVNATFDILNNGCDSSVINHTFIVLIPKVKTPETPKDFWLISLCNVIFLSYNQSYS